MEQSEYFHEIIILVANSCQVGILHSQIPIYYNILYGLPFMVSAGVMASQLSDKHHNFLRTPRHPCGGQATTTLLVVFSLQQLCPRHDFSQPQRGIPIACLASHVEGDSVAKLDQVPTCIDVLQLVDNLSLSLLGVFSALTCIPPGNVLLLITQ